MSNEMLLLLAFVVKHFVCDYPLQACPWMYKNKGQYGHLGGIAHASVHCIGTALALCWYPIPFGMVTMLSVGDAVIHYHIDWAKMNIGARMNWKPDNSESFWILLGLDQLLHYITYFAIVWIIV